MSQIGALGGIASSVVRSPHRRGPRKRDGVLLGVIVTLAFLEAAASVTPGWTPASLIVCVALTPTVLWRRSQPLLMVVIAFGSSAALDVAGLLAGRNLPTLNTTAFLLLLPYSLFRWGTAREAMLGVPIILIAAAVGFISDDAGASDVIGGSAVLIAAVALGAAVRYRDRARSRELEQVKLREREQLARDLHDTVAHHVTAIAIRAQAGLATSAMNPEAAVEALHVIEHEATRTLTEMRSMVRILRRDDSAGVTPNPCIADLERLAAAPSARTPRIEVDLSGDLDDVSPPVSAAIYRLAQESVTNAQRHAQRATRIEITVSADETSVHLRVSDDGGVVHQAAVGYGLLGMIERAELLGGTCRAGPKPKRGWMVTAVLPRNGPAI